MVHSRVHEYSARGRHQVFDRELLETTSRLLRFAHRLTRDEEQANELVQETLLHALERWNQYIPGTHMVSWLMKILYSLFVDGCRKRRVRQRACSHTVIFRRSYSDSNHEFIVLLKEVLVKMAHVLPRDRIELLLLLAQGHSYKEIARLLDVKVVTVSSQVCRARDALLCTLGVDHFVRGDELSWPKYTLKSD
jgi:RNA polymerase sigma-70 factor, ECF subfamily